MLSPILPAFVAMVHFDFVVVVVVVGWINWTVALLFYLLLLLTREVGGKGRRHEVVLFCWCTAFPVKEEEEKRYVECIVEGSRCSLVLVA